MYYLLKTKTTLRGQQKLKTGWPITAQIYWQNREVSNLATEMGYKFFILYCEMICLHAKA